MYFDGMHKFYVIRMYCVAIWVHRRSTSVNIRRVASIRRQIIYPDARPVEPLPEQRPHHPVSSSSTYRCLRESQVSWLGVGYELVTISVSEFTFFGVIGNSNYFANLKFQIQFQFRLFKKINSNSKSNSNYFSNTFKLQFKIYFCE